MITTGVSGLDGKVHDVCVIGTGPVGISLAFELAKAGRSVLLLESGELQASAEAQRLSDAEIADPKTHVAMDIAVQRSLGGTSNLWGGRCVSFDPVDFTVRPAIPHSGWPISMADVEPHMAAACDYIGCGAPVFESPLPGFDGGDGDFDFKRLERWSLQPRFSVMYERKLREAATIDLRLRATVTGLSFAADGQVERVHVRGPGDTKASFAARAVVLAAGALESTRLLLLARRDAPGRFGGPEGPLGRYYMGHLYGVAAEMDLTSETLDAGIDYFADPQGYYVRRRFTPSADLQARMGLTNFSLWPDYPLIRDPAHRNGVLSLAYLALSVPPVGRMIVAESIRRHYVGDTVQRLPHILNVLRELPRTTAFIPSFLYGRYLAKHRKPGFFQRNAGRRYAIRFHAEQLPNPDSRVTLSDQHDAYGVPRLAIDLRYRAADAEPLIRGHDCFAAWLRSSGSGTMRWLVPEAERVDYILSQCYDGHHQIGTLRMGEGPGTGVVDKDCRVFGAANLFVAGSAVFPTSAEANPTLTAVALAMRLAGRLAQELPGA
ncbi:GMC family oxidoreductase [Xanthobacter sp. DSM 24535]|uniref:FAD-dependent oxidoreductase n=1 Tax=Roseixanthobacter psychrophilus TaxID=3119917 RepID=UPI0037263F4D